MGIGKRVKTTNPAGMPESYQKEAAERVQEEEIEFAINNAEPEVRVPFAPWPKVEYQVGPEASEWNAWIVMGRDRTGNYADTRTSENKDPFTNMLVADETRYVEEAAGQIAERFGVGSPFGSSDANMQANIDYDGPPSGWGPAGATHAGAIDLVVGRLSADASGKLLKLHPARDRIHPHFGTDAARVYISQKSNVDHAFHLAPGRAGDLPARSTVAMKADTIRVIGREGIKLVTGTDVYNSLGHHGDGAGKIMSTIGIDLIAGNNDANLQPLVKGKALIRCLREIMMEVKHLGGQVADLANQVGLLASDYSIHTHIAKGPAAPVTPPPWAGIVAGYITERTATVAANVLAIGVNLITSVEHTFLGQPGIEGSGGPDDPVHHREYICSRYNNTN
tara:strand:- start:658 stop:1836 length:1179 start_codon:yes stop_codon:yes gene_type:complete